MTDSSTLIVAGFFFVMGAAVIGVVWYLQSVVSGNFHKGKRSPKPDPNLVEVARLMRDKTTQDLVVTINGNTFRLAKELNPGQLRRLHFASRVLAKWLADTPPIPLTEAGAPALAGEGAPTNHASAEPASPEIVPPDEEWIPAESALDATKPDSSPSFIPEQAQEIKPVSTQLSDVVSGILKPARASTSTPEFKSIAMQIDEILQQMIADTPYEQRGITVNDSPDHGVMVTLDGNQYPGVKDVPDEEVRNLIRSAVVEWEKTGKFSSR